MNTLPRRALLGLPLALAGCGLAQRPYLARTDWPLTVPAPPALPPRKGGRILLVRALGAGPGLTQRGLQVLEPDGSLHVSYYQQWAVPPAEGATAALRLALAGSGLFAAVIAPGSLLAADLVLEGELTTLLARAADRQAVAEAGFRLLARRGGAERLVLNTVAGGTAPIAQLAGAAIAAAERQALAQVFARLTARLAEALR